MERPAKRSRTGPSHFQDEEDDIDELEFLPEEVNLRRDPGYQLQRSRAFAAFKLKSAFEAIFEKYEKDFTGIGDEINLRTGEVVVDNGHLKSLQDPGKEQTPSEAGWDAREGRALQGDVATKASMPKAQPRMPALSNGAVQTGIPPPIMTPPHFGMRFPPGSFDSFGPGASSIEPAWRTPDLPARALGNGHLPQNPSRRQQKTLTRKTPLRPVPGDDSDEDDILGRGSHEPSNSGNNRGPTVHPPAKIIEVPEVAPGPTVPASSSMEFLASNTPSPRGVSSDPTSAPTSAPATISLPPPSGTPIRLIPQAPQEETVPSISGSVSVKAAACEDLSAQARDDCIERELQADTQLENGPSRAQETASKAATCSASFAETRLATAKRPRNSNFKIKQREGRSRVAKAGKGQKAPWQSEKVVPRKVVRQSSPSGLLALSSSLRRRSSRRLQKHSESYEDQAFSQVELAKKLDNQILVVEIVQTNARKGKLVPMAEGDVVEVLTPEATPRATPERKLHTDLSEFAGAMPDPNIPGEVYRQVQQELAFNDSAPTPPACRAAEKLANGATEPVEIFSRNAVDPSYSFSDDDENSMLQVQPATESQHAKDSGPAISLTMEDTPSVSSTSGEAALADIEITRLMEPEDAIARRLKPSDCKEGSQEDKGQCPGEGTSRLEVTPDRLTFKSAPRKLSDREQKKTEAAHPRLSLSQASTTPHAGVPEPAERLVLTHDSSGQQHQHQHQHQHQLPPLATPQNRTRAPRTTLNSISKHPLLSSSRKSLMSLVPINPDDPDADELALGPEDFLTPRGSDRRRSVFKSAFSYAPRGSASLRRSLPLLLGSGGANTGSRSSEPWWPQVQTQTPTANGRRVDGAGTGTGAGKRPFLYSGAMEDRFERRRRGGNGQDGGDSGDSDGRRQGGGDSSPVGSMFILTPRGTLRRCGEDGFRCDRDFCFVCL